MQIQTRTRAASATLTGLLILLAGCSSPSDKALDAQAQATKAEAQTNSLQAYSNYVLEMQKLNTDRQSKNLPPLTIPSYQTWVGQANSGK